MVADQPFAGWLLDKITDYQVEMAKRCVASGVDCGRTGDDGGSQRGMLFSQALARVWAVYQDAGLPVLHHCCGDIRPIIADF